MKRISRRGWIWGLTALAIAIFATTHGKPGQAAKKNDKARVGVYESRALALAYGRSDAFQKKIQELRKTMEQAKKTGDKKQVEIIKTQGPRSQDLLHRQVFGDAPIPNVLETIEKEMARVAKEANVDVIVTGVVHAGATVEIVDLTEALVRLFNPTEATLKMALDISNNPPLEWHRFPIED